LPGPRPAVIASTRHPAKIMIFHLKPSGSLGFTEAAGGAEMHGAGEGNRTLVCSLGSKPFLKAINPLAAKRVQSRINNFNALDSGNKTKELFQLLQIWFRRSLRVLMKMR